MRPAVSGPAQRRPRRRLAARVYAFSIASALLAGGAAAVAVKLALQPQWEPLMAEYARYLVAGAAAERADPGRFQETVARVRRDLHVGLAFYDRDGALVTASTDSPPPAPSDDERARLGRSGVLAREPAEVFVVALDGASGAGVADGAGRARRDPAPAYAVAVVVDPTTVNARLALIAVLGLAALGLASWLFARALTRPLGRLAGAARAFGAGELDARSALGSNDELGEVSRAFDDMAERVTRLLRAHKLLLADVSHELRTPLARMRVALDLAAEAPDPVGQRSLHELRADLDELESLVGDLLTAGRLDAYVPGEAPPALAGEEIDAGALVAEAAERFRRSHPGRALRVDAGPPLGLLTGDRALLRRAIDNLLDNARKYSEPDSEIVLAAAAGDDRTLIVEVRDRGIGVEAEHLADVFTPFFRSDRSRARSTGGVGLGLALVRRIVEAHRGRVEIESEVGVGTAVRFRIPLAPG